MTDKEITFSITTENHPGILFRIAAVFLRRNINIEVLNVAESPREEGVSYFIITVYVDREMAVKLARQLEKIVGVYGVDCSK